MYNDNNTTRGRHNFCVDEYFMAGSKNPEVLFFLQEVSIQKIKHQRAAEPCEGGGRRACHLVLGQEFALPQRVRDVVDGEPQVVGAVFEIEGLWFIQQLPAHLLLHLEHFLKTHVEKKKQNLVVNAFCPYR